MDFFLILNIFVHLKMKLWKIRCAASPSGCYELTIHAYGTSNVSGKKTLEYTKGIIRNIHTKDVIAEICRDYSSFEHNFFYEK